jgi:integrase
MARQVATLNSACYSSCCTGICFSGSIENRDRKKILSHWKRVQKLIVKTQLSPKDFYTRRKKIFKHLRDDNYSLDYSKKLIRILNQFGEFVCEHQGQFFKPIPKMTGHEANQIREAYHESKTFRGESKILTPQKLEKIKDQLKPEQYRWLYISVWAGLRPKEIDLLQNSSDAERYKVTSTMVEKRNVPVLEVYQSKLASVHRDHRWKYIPLFLKEQQKILTYLEQNLKRPLNKTLKKLTNEKITCYGGRKGFTDLMLSHNQELEDISSWLGHSSIETTWKVYRNKKRVNFKKVS